MSVVKLAFGIFYSFLLFGMSVSSPQKDRRVRNNISGSDNTRAKIIRRENHNGKILFEDLDPEPLLPKPTLPTVYASSKISEKELGGTSWNKNIKPTTLIPIKEATNNYISKNPNLSTSAFPIRTTENIKNISIVISNEATSTSAITPKSTAASSTSRTFETEEPILEGHYYIPFRKMNANNKTNKRHSSYSRENRAFT